MIKYPPTLLPATWNKQGKPSPVLGKALEQLHKLHGDADFSVFDGSGLDTVAALEAQVAKADQAMKKAVRSLVDQAGKVSSAAKKLQAELKSDKQAPKGSVQAAADVADAANKYLMALAVQAEAAQTAMLKQLAKLRAEAKAAKPAAAAQAAPTGDDAAEKLVRGKVLAAMRVVRSAQPGAKPVQFMVAAGSKQVTAYLSTSVGASHRALLKKLMPEEKSVKFYTGECVFENKAWTFVGDSIPTGGFAKRLQKGLQDLTGVRYAVRVRKFDGEADEAEGDDDGGRDQPKDKAKDRKTSGPDPLKAFTARLGALMPHIKQALAAGGPLAAQIKKASAEAAALAKARDGAAKAGKKLDELETLVREAQAAARKAAAEPEPARVSLVVDGSKLNNVTEAEAREALLAYRRKLHARVEGDYAGHEHLWKVRRENVAAAWVVQGVSKLFRGKDLPELDIWDQPRKLLEAAFAQLKKNGPIDTCAKLLAAAEQECNRSHVLLVNFQKDTDEAVEVTIEGLKLTRNVAAATVVAGSGGLAGAAGLSSAATLGVTTATAGGIAAVNKGAEEWSSVYMAETKKTISWAAIGKEGLAAAAKNLAGGIAKGFLTERFSHLFGAYLSKAKFPDSVLLEMGKRAGLPGPVPREYLMTATQKFARDFVVGKGVGQITKWVEAAIKGPAAKKQDQSIQEFLERVVKEAIKDGASKKLVEYMVTHASDYVKPK